MPSFEILDYIFTCLSVFDSPKGSSNTVKTRKNISLYFRRRHLIIYNYLRDLQYDFIPLLTLCIDHRLFGICFIRNEHNFTPTIIHLGIIVVKKVSSVVAKLGQKMKAYHRVEVR